MRLVLLLAVVCSSLVALPPAGKCLPSTGFEVELCVKHVEQELDRTAREIVTAQTKSFNSVARPLHRLSDELMSYFSLLSFVAMSEKDSSKRAQEAIGYLQEAIEKRIAKNQELKNAVLSYAKSALHNPSTPPHEMYDVYSLLSSFSEGEALRAACESKPKTPFIYIRGASQEKHGADLKVLSLNTCFNLGNFPFLFGGVIKPWRERLQQMASKIVSADADVVCLQEVTNIETSFALYELLKQHYAHFYVAIGAKPMGFSFSSLTLPSGLFVASKYPIESPTFTPFKETGLPMHFGFFDFVVTGKGKPLAHVYTTHMQALNLPGFDEIRAAEINQMLAKMEDESGDLPIFLCGDLNVPFSTEEPGLLLIQKHFYDHYNECRCTPKKDHHTCTEYFSNYLLSETRNPDHIRPNYQILDYALLLKLTPKGKAVGAESTIHTELLKMNDIRDPENALSDHHGLLTTISRQLAN